MALFEPDVALAALRQDPTGAGAVQVDAFDLAEPAFGFGAFTVGD